MIICLLGKSWCNHNCSQCYQGVWVDRDVQEFSLISSKKNKERIQCLELAINRYWQLEFSINVSVRQNLSTHYIDGFIDGMTFGIWNDSVWFSGVLSAGNMSSHLTYLIEWMNLTLTFGKTEFVSICQALLLLFLLPPLG